MMMNFTSPFVFLASEKVSSDSLFEGFQVDLESTANLVKSLADFNPTVWSYMTAITKGIMQPLGVAILAVVLVLEFSKMAKKIANSGGANYDTISGIKGSGIVGKMIIGFFAILIWLVRMTSIMVVNILITIRFIQLYLMIPFAPVTIPTFLSDDWRSVGIGYLKNIMVYAVQGILIFLIVSLVPLFESAGKIAVSNGAGVMESLAIMFGGLVQAILLIIALVGSQRTARSILGM